MAKTVETIEESDSWRNILFKDNRNWVKMTRPEFVKQIEDWNYSDYHVRIIHRIKTPVSNPDKTASNNLN